MMEGMKMRGMMRRVLALGVLAAVYAGVLGMVGLLSPGEAAAQNTPCFRPQGGAAFVCGNGGRVEIREGAQLEVQAGGLLELLPGDVVTVTDGQTVTVGSAYVALGSAGTVTVTLAAGAAGTLATVVNTTATTINVADGGTARLAGAAALGQFDTLLLLSDGTGWNEISRSDN